MSRLDVRCVFNSEISKARFIRWPEIFETVHHIYTFIVHTHTNVDYTHKIHI